MKILVIPDVHSRRFWKRPFERYKNRVDKVVFLGDYCDPYEDEGIEYEWEDTLRNLSEIIEVKKKYPDKVILLLGNHDMHYRSVQFEEKSRSTRYDAIHANKLHSMFNGDNRKLFQLAYVVDNADKKVIFTHAGITDFWFEKCDFGIDENLEENLNNLEESAEGIGKLAVIGRERTGFWGAKTGSMIWCDVGEYAAYGGIGGNTFQIFGHTRLIPGAIASKGDFACVDSKTVFVLNDKNKLRRVKDEKVKADKEHGTVQDTENDKP